MDRLLREYGGTARNRDRILTAYYSTENRMNNNRILRDYANGRFSIPNPGRPEYYRRAYRSDAPTRLTETVRRLGDAARPGFLANSNG